MSVLTRYLLRAHIGPFFFALFMLTGVILINTLAKELASFAGKGLPIMIILEFFALSLPANLALTLPMSVLVAVLYTFSTLASENEITALRANGIDLRRFTFPLLVTAAVIASVMVWFNNRVLPASNYEWRLLMTDVAQTRPLLQFQEGVINPIEDNTGTTPYYLEATELDSGTGRMKGVSIWDVSSDQITRTIEADSGSMLINRSGTDLLLTLHNGQVQEVDFSDPAAHRIFQFEKQVMRFDGVSQTLERTAEASYRTDRDMTLGMMQARIDSARVELEAFLKAVEDPTQIGIATRLSSDDPISTQPVPLSTTPADTTAAAIEPNDAGRESPAAVVTGQAPPTDSVAVEPAEPAAPAPDPSLLELAGRDPREYAQSKAEALQAEIRGLQVEIQKKFSIAAAALVFVLIGIPIALRFPQGGIGMVIAVSLTIFGIYYVGLIGGETLANKGYLSPALSMWMTDIVFGTLGLIGWLRLGHEQGTSRGGGFDLFTFLGSFFSRFRRQRTT